MLPAPLQFLIAMIAYAINERMQRKLDQMQEEVRVLKEILAALTGAGRISFTEDQRRHRWLEERKKCCQVVKPGTIFGWFRHLAARKYDSSKAPNKKLKRSWFAAALCEAQSRVRFHASCFPDNLSETRASTHCPSRSALLF